jgi:predicted nucleic acid-binding protein
VREVLGVIRGLCRVEPVTFSVHEHGVALAERFGFQLYDAMILASAIKAGCKTLYSEDLQNGQTIEGLTIRNPFAGL